MTPERLKNSFESFSSENKKSQNQKTVKVFFILPLIFNTSLIIFLFS